MWYPANIRAYRARISLVCKNISSSMLKNSAAVHLFLGIADSFPQVPRFIALLTKYRNGCII